MDSNIRVIARVKPLSAAESVEGKCLHVSSRRDITLNSNNSLFATRRFKLNCVLDEEASQDDVFQSIGPLLNNFMTGYNCTVFMYGQTGSGKTHTMLGYDLWNMVEKSPGTPTFATDESLLGIIPKSMQWLFAELSTNSFISEVLVSYIELYNDVKLFDLLSPSASESQQLDIREAKHGEIIIPGLTRLKVSSIADVLDALWSGAKFRHVAATDMNDYSSRSHTVFTVYLSIRNSAEGVQSKLNLVDLAGSEKWKSSQLAALSAERVKELTCINRSLSALGNCVSALMRKNRSHIPYRDAKLTRLLQDSLGGNTLTLFVVTISASIRNVEETASTLQFADRAMKVQVLVTKNSISSNETVDHLKLEIKNLKMLLHSVLAKSGSSDSSSATNIGVGNSSDIIESLNGEVQSLRDENISVLQMLKAAQEQLQSSQEENIRLLEILGSKKFEYSASLKDPLKSKKSQSNLINQFPDEIKLSILQARSEELEHRLQAAENIEAIQEERWGLLLNYHNWLQRQVADNTTGSEFGVAASDVYKRVELMEGSILVQADELRRAKKNFLQSNTELHSRLSTALQENMKLRRQALEGFAGSITADSQSSHFVAKSNPSAIGDIALDTKPPFPPCHQEESDYSVESDRNIYNSDPKSPACGLLSPVQESRPPSPVQSPTSTGAEIASDVTAIAYTVPGIRLASSPKSSNCSTNTKLRPLVGKYKVDSSFIGIQPKKSVTTNEKEVKKQTPLAACITPSLCNYSKDHIAEKAKVVEVNVANALEHANEIFMRQRERQILEQTKHNPGNVCQSQTVSRTTFEDGCIQVLSADDSSSDLPIPDINESSEVVAAEHRISVPKKMSRMKIKKPKLLWQQFTDNDSGNSYYYNRSTRETTWDKPSDIEMKKYLISEMDDCENVKMSL